CRGAGSNRGQRPRERGQPPEFRFVAHLAPSRVIAVLLAASGVAADGLQVFIGVRTNPDVRPRRRYDQGSDALAGRLVDCFPVRPYIAKTSRWADATNSVCGLVDVFQPCRDRRLDRVERANGALSPRQ